MSDVNTIIPDRTSCFNCMEDVADDGSTIYFCTRDEETDGLCEFMNSIEVNGEWVNTCTR